MKSLFTLFIVFAFILSTFSQSIIKRQIENCDKQFHQEIFDPIVLQDCNNTRFGFHTHYQNDSWQNSLELKQSLDSIVSEFNNDGTWTKYHHSDYTYNPKGYNIQSIQYGLNEEESEIIPKYKDDFFFDETGKVTSINHSRRDEFTGVWSYSSKRDYAYDENNNLTAYVLYGWNKTNSDWLPFNKGQYEYDLSEKIIQRRSYGWNDISNDWDFTIKEDFTYDENNYLVERITYTTIGPDEWHGLLKVEYLNDQNGNTIETTTYNKALDSDWEYKSREKREFNFTGLITKLVYIYYVDSISQWINDQRQDYVYDEHENLMESVTFFWDTISDDWKFVSKAELIYNLNFMHDDLLLPASWPEFGITYGIMPLYNNQLVEVNYFTINDTVWELDNREIYFYGERDVSAVPEVAVNSIEIYPNPADDMINIKGIYTSTPLSIELFDLQGKLLLKYENPASNRFDVSHLETGLYICKIRHNGQNTNYKILIR